MVVVFLKSCITPCAGRTIVSNVAYLFLLNKKTPLTFCQRRNRNKKRPQQKPTFCQGRITNAIRGATLFHGKTVPLAGYQHIPGVYTLACSVAEYSGKSHLTAPSAAHLTTCFLPDSQHHRLSVKASLPLFPLQRFIVLNYYTFYADVFLLSIGKRYFQKKVFLRYICVGRLPVPLVFV